MTQEEAIARIRIHKNVHKMNEPRAINISEALDMAIKALEQETCEDCISRQAVIDEIEFYQINPQHFDFVSLIGDIKDLPPVTPQQTRWIPVSERLPEKLKDVLVTFYDCPGEYDVAYLRTTFNETYKKNGAKNEWVSSMGETTYADYEVDVWMPIEPYKESEE